MSEADFSDMNLAVPERVDAVIVGAGFGGIAQLHALKQLGLTCRVVEAGSDVGGTWFWNRYPGARVDVESAWYSYRFSPELDQDWEWSEKLPVQSEILRYLRHVVDRFGLREDMVFDTRVTTATWHDDAAEWELDTDTGARLRARYVVMATGTLSRVKGLEVPGMERFAGDVHHTGSWPHDGVDFTGQRVGVVGTGSSGIQAIPLIAEQAEQLVVFQRTPAFALPARNRPLDPDEVAELKRDYPAWRERQRETYLGIPDPQPTRSALEVSEAEREARYEAGWEQGGLNALLTAYNDLFVDREANETLAEFVRGKIRSIVDDPQVAEDLSPRSYAIGAKRACLQTGYYETFNRPNVTLVNLRRTPLVEVTEHGVRTTEAEFELDALVLATGFDAITGSVLAIDIHGRDGVAMDEAWRDGAMAYLGLGVAGFPNLFLVTGPGSPSVLSNMAFSIQEHTEWIAATIAHLEEHGLATIEATSEAQAEWARLVGEIAGSTLFPTADSYYNGANVPGKPRTFPIFVAGVAEYGAQLRRVTADGYEGFKLGAARRPQPAAEGQAR